MYVKQNISLYFERVKLYKALYSALIPTHFNLLTLIAVYNIQKHGCHRYTVFSHQKDFICLK